MCNVPETARKIFLPLSYLSCSLERKYFQVSSAMEAIMLSLLSSFSLESETKTAIATCLPFSV